MSAIPTSPLVAQAWLKTLPELLAGAAMNLPKDPAVWAETGFVLVSVTGGAGHRYVQMRAPVISIDSWAMSLNSGQAPVAKASQNAEIIRASTFQDDRFPVVVQPGPGDYLPAIVHSAYPLQDEPRRIPDPNGSYAHMQFDLALMWTVKE